MFSSMGFIDNTKKEEKAKNLGASKMEFSFPLVQLQLLAVFWLLLLNPIQHTSLICTVV